MAKRLNLTSRPPRHCGEEELATNNTNGTNETCLHSSSEIHALKSFFQSSSSEVKQG